MTIEEELVRKSRNVSAGLLWDRREENASRKPVKVCSHAVGKDSSVGSNGKYHHLHTSALSSHGLVPHPLTYFT